MTVLVTGSKGMIGSSLIHELLQKGYDVIGVDRSNDFPQIENYYYYAVELSDNVKLRDIFNSHDINRVIHLAALAHTEGESDLSWDRYYQNNVICTKNVVTLAFERKVPVLFISTVDVYGFVDSIVNLHTDPQPVTNYAKSKYQAEKTIAELADIFSAQYNIFRLSPVYSDSIKRDIQKRYYFRYPTVAYKIGKGQEYEIVNIKKAVREMVYWCENEPDNNIRIIKDNHNMWTPDYIRNEKKAGRAKVVLRVPQWTVNFGYAILIRIFGKNEKTYLLNKVVYPLRSE